MIELELRDFRSFLGGRSPHLPLNGVLKVRGLRIPFRFLQGMDSDFLLIHYNGAVDRKVKPDGVVFQRSSWAKNFKSSILYLADPAIIPHPNMTLGWGQTPLNGAYFPEVAAEIALEADKTLKSSKRVHLGSSAGGFQAAAASLYDPDSVAWVNNAQFDWSLYDIPSAVQKVIQSLHLSSIDELQQKAPWRKTIPELVHHLGQAPRIHYVLNSLSQSDMSTQFPTFEKLQTLSGGVTLEKYEDAESGHNPLPEKEWFERLHGFMSVLT